MLPNPPIMLITDAAQAVLPLEHVIDGALKGGCRWVLLRDINASDDALLKQAISIKKICATYNAKLFISRNVNVANAIDADGIHFSSSQTISKNNNMIIGQSCHNANEIISAEKNGTNYITLSPVFETFSKPNATSLGLEKFKMLVGQTKKPVIALGGMNVERAKQSMGAGANGIAIMGDMMRSENPEACMRMYINLFHTI
jgi:thiamine-phosphate pyrophosphorylase